MKNKFRRQTTIKEKKTKKLFSSLRKPTEALNQRGYTIYRGVIQHTDSQIPVLRITALADCESSGALMAVHTFSSSLLRGEASLTLMSEAPAYMLLCY